MSLSIYSDFIDVLWRKADQGHTSTSPFPSSWLRVMLGFKPDFLQDNFSLRVLHQPLLFFFLPYFRISSKYRQRRLIPRLSVSHSHTGSQVYARLMRHITCAGKKKEKGKRKETKGHICKSLSKQITNSEERNSTVDAKVSFELKGPVDH